MNARIAVYCVPKGKSITPSKLRDYGLQLTWMTSEKEQEREGKKKTIRSLTATLADRLLPLGTPPGLAEKSHGVWQCAEEQV